VQPRRGRHGRCSGPPEAALRQSAPARHMVRALRSRPMSRVRPDQTGGDPAAPVGSRIASTAAEAGDHSLTLGNRQAAGRRCAALRRRPRLALLRRAREGRVAPRCAKPQARPEESGRMASLRGNASCRWRGRLHGRRRHRSTAEPVARCRRRPFWLNGAPVPAPDKLRSPGLPARRAAAPCPTTRGLVALLRRSTATTSRRSPRLALRRA